MMSREGFRRGSEGSGTDRVESGMSGFSLASLVSSEVRAVEAAMRINSRWSALMPEPMGMYTSNSRGGGGAHQYHGGVLIDDNENGMSDGAKLVLELRRLRRNAFDWGNRGRAASGRGTSSSGSVMRGETNNGNAELGLSSKEIDPLLYLSPFLEIIRSEETNGPITGMALNALHKLISADLFDSTTTNAKKAMDAIVCAVTQCRFEATDPASDEVVLSKILYVLLDCARSETACLLSDRNVCDIVQACFRIGHQTGKEGELLQRMARSYMVEIVKEIFANLVAQRGFEERNKMESSGNGDGGDEKDGMNSSRQEAGRRKEVVQDLDEEDGVQIDIEEGCFGLASAIEIFQFATSLFTIDFNSSNVNDSTFDEEMAVFGLLLILTILEQVGPVFESFPSLLDIAKDDLMRSLLSSRSSNSVLVLSLSCSVFLSLYIHARQHLVVQLESFVHGVLLRLAEGRVYSSGDQQIIALEALSDLCRHPLFILDMYSTYDCAVECSNLFEDLCSVLSKTAFPVNAPLSRMHLLALDGLIAIVSCMAERCKSNTVSYDDLSKSEAGSNTSLIDPERKNEISQGVVYDSVEDLKEYNEIIWNDISAGPGVDRDSKATSEKCFFLAKRQKFVKRRLLVAIDHFNRKPKKGLEFLQHIHLLPDPLEPHAVASFLRMTPGLDKNLIGEYLGDPGEFQIEVLTQFTSMFDFGHMELDMAMRSYLTSFRLPGEAQKISRILEAFADMFHKQSKEADAGGEGEAWSKAKNADAIYVLSYSVIMLNTDLHNDQVKKKMSLDAFIRNNRGTNEGDDWPRDVLHRIYDSIEKYEIRMKDDGDALDITPGQWTAKLRRAEKKYLNCFGDTTDKERGIVSGYSCSPFDKDMFAIFWGPTIAALSVVFDHAEDDSVVGEVVEGFMNVAKVASFHNFIDVMDNLVISLCKFSALLNPTAMKPAVTFGNDDKARVAVVCVFSLAHKYGDCIRNSWRNILDLIIRMHKLNILDHEDAVVKDKIPEGEHPAEQSNGIGNKETSSIIAAVSRQSHHAVRSQTDIQKSSSLTNYMATTLSRAFGLSSEEDQSNDDGSKSGKHIASDANGRGEDYEAEKRTFKCVDDCRIDDIFTESKFLETGALFQLVRALIWAGGMPSTTGTGAPGNAGSVGYSGGLVDEDTTVFCLGLLMTITLRNRDRIRHIWDAVHEHLSVIILTATVTTPLVEVAVTELLRLCQRLLPYKEEIAEKLLVSLQLVLKLNEQVAYDLAVSIMKEVVCMLKGSVSHIKSADGWKTLLILVLKTSKHPEASSLSFEALTIICKFDNDTSLEEENANEGDVKMGESTDMSSFLTPASFTICLDSLISFVEASDGGDQRSIDALELMTPMHGKLVQWYKDKELKIEQIIILWEKLVRSITECCTDTRANVRDAAIVLLARALACAHELELSMEKWTTMFEQIVFPLLNHLIKGVKSRNQKTSSSDASRTLRAGVALMCKAFLLPTSSSTLASYTNSENFGKLWNEVLSILVECHKAAVNMKVDKPNADQEDGSTGKGGKEELVDAVIEAAKNMILVLVSQESIVKDSEVWRETFKKAVTISPTLDEEMLLGTQE